MALGLEQNDEIIKRQLAQKMNSSPKTFRRSVRLTPGRIPPFEEVYPEQVKFEWTTHRREEAKRKAFADIRQRYEIVLPNS